MKIISVSIAGMLALTTFFLSANVAAQQSRQRTAVVRCGAESGLNGLYRIDFENSDRLYSVIEGASSTVPFAEQQQFFIDLAVRLTPPDLLAIECRESRVSLASSRAARVEFRADGVTRGTPAAGGAGTIRSRIWLDRSGLNFSSSGGASDNLSVNFSPLDNGRRLRVTRRISDRELIEPVVIRTVYNKIQETARWDIFEDDRGAERPGSRTAVRTAPPDSPPRPAERNQRNAAENLRGRLDEWIAATNRRDIERQMSFYMPRLKAFYLTRNAPASLVRSEKNRAFAAARTIDIRAAEPEIIFQNGGREAIMRFRKRYEIVNGGRRRTGEVVQELRWEQAGPDWKINSERDIRVIR